MTLRRSDGLRRKTEAEISTNDRARSSHTGTQAIGTIEGLSDDLDTLSTAAATALTSAGSRALAEAVGVTSDATDLGQFASPLIDDDLPVKGAIESIGTNLAASGGSGNVGHTDGGTGSVNETSAAVLRRVPVTPEAYGAETSDTDCTVQMQNAIDAAADDGRVLDGNGRTYRWKTASIPSNSIIRNLNCLVPNDTADNGPFFIDGQVSEKSNILLENCHVDGNRIGQTLLASSGGDGQRAGFKLFGRTRAVTILNSSALRCATDGFFIWTGSLEPEDADDLLHNDLSIIDSSSLWNGRHGLSITSHRNTLIKGGKWQYNGDDLPGFSGVYSDGGYARRLPGNLSGVRYGRGITHEQFYLGEHYENFRIEEVDHRFNRGGVLLYHVMFPTVRAAKDLFVRGGIFDDQFGGVGDGPFITYAVLCPNNDGSGSRTVYTGTDAFDGLSFAGVEFAQNYINLSNARKISFSGSAHPNVTASQYSVIYTNCLNVISADIKTNKPQLGRPSPLTNTSITLPSGWASSGAMLSDPKDIIDGYSYLYAVLLTPDGAGVEKTSFVFTSGFTISPTFCSVLNNNTAAPVLGTLRLGSNGVNELDLWLSPADTAPLSVLIGFEARRNP